MYVLFFPAFLVPLFFLCAPQSYSLDDVERPQVKQGFLVGTNLKTPKGKKLLALIWSLGKLYHPMMSSLGAEVLDLQGKPIMPSAEIATEIQRATSLLEIEDGIIHNVRGSSG
jgi:hypothetical protein